MSSSPPTISSKFPSGYGNFAIWSSDDVICYFPSQILAHVSSIFGDMLDVAHPDKDQKPLEIEEPIKLLELFLVHVDPNIVSLSIDPNTIEELLKMADKYCVNRILRWFEQEAHLSRASTFDSTVQEPFTNTHPSLVLLLAIQHNFQDLGRVALRELAGYDLSTILDHEQKFSPDIIRAINCMQRARLMQYHSWISTMVAYPSGSNCATCHRSLRKHIVEIMKEIQVRPVWRVFIALYRAGDFGCAAKNCNGVQINSFHIDDWQKIALQKESELPEWPL